ncbi:MAG: FtsQ-type POTRA domain-containing protein [Anaerolineaceae bacterium]|nr:FtsQ-type POTRA domain-containing protein [Anaerolineaceae bacterium]
MTSRLRDRRRSSTREPGILRGSVGATLPAERSAVQHGALRLGFTSWRMFSGFIVISLSILLFLFFTADFFYVHSIAVGGLKYMTKEEVFALTNIANMHIFWVDPAEVKRNILRSPTVADADVQVGWPPQMVQIVIQEREPAVVWVQSSVPTWVDIQGRIMNQREDRPDLLKVLSDVQDGPLGQNVQLSVDIISGALQLKALNPTMTTVRYNPSKGLGYQDSRGWLAWFGVGTDMPEKISIYNAMVNNLISRGIQVSEINIVNPDAPFYSALRGQ